MRKYRHKALQQARDASGGDSEAATGSAGDEGEKEVEDELEIEDVNGGTRRVSMVPTPCTCGLASTKRDLAPQGLAQGNAGEELDKLSGGSEQSQRSEEQVNVLPK